MRQEAECDCFSDKVGASHSPRPEPRQTSVISIDWCCAKKHKVSLASRTAASVKPHGMGFPGCPCRVRARLNQRQMTHQCCWVQSNLKDACIHVRVFHTVVIIPMPYSFEDLNRRSIGQLKGVGLRNAGHLELIFMLYLLKILFMEWLCCLKCRSNTLHNNLSCNENTV